MAECGIAYVETRLEFVEDIHEHGVVLYGALTRETAAIAEVFVLRSIFDGEPPKEIILTVTPA